MLPIHSIDLAYYSKMFWFYNKAENKVKEPSMEINEHFSDSMTVRLFCLLEDMYNSGDSAGYHKDALIDMVTADTFWEGAIEHVTREYDKMIAAMLKSGWDPRCKVKASVRSIGKVYQILEFAMDLDKTIASIKEEEELYEGTTITGEDIIDNPSSEELAEYDKQIPKSK